MGKVYSRILRPIRSFNIEHRTERIISKEKPAPAPQYPSANKQREFVDKMYPDIKETLSKKNIKLDSHLKNVYVTSTDPKGKPKEISSTRSLPQNRSQPSAYESDFSNGDVVTPGKCTLKEALAFIIQHRENPTEYSVERIAHDYKLNKEIVANIIEYYRVPKLLEAPQQETTVQKSTNVEEN
ncbi:NADH dehydrogenase [ubiquinone] 1 alpha subcomplex assembly factor 4 [Calliopsis andreniformis]|uniref:NADH dehydrogenase [ubiquinone] 1 alpha subcomplex assembly factor 4 n=1 Tax=Calliopsis andreniformis TaxID=337506 RepID=UPI003FCCC010